MASLSYALHGLGLPPDRLGPLSASNGVPMWPETGGADSLSAVPTAKGPDRVPDRVVVLVGADILAEEVGARVAPPYCAWIEVAFLSDDMIAAALAEAARHHLYASFTTVTANGIDLTGQLVGAIDSRRPLADTAREDLELALHEAVTNAVVHGNLQVDGMKGLSVCALDRFSQALSERMSDPDYAHRRVEVTIDFDATGVAIDVVDQGHGFTPKPRTAGDASGRGLELIAAIAEDFELLENGRRIRMRFRL